MEELLPSVQYMASYFILPLIEQVPAGLEDEIGM